MKHCAWLILSSFVTLLAASASSSGRQIAPSAGSKNFVLVAHGGAGDYSQIPPEQIEERRTAMKKAIGAGYDVLARKGSSLDAVEATIRETTCCCRRLKHSYSEEL